MNTGSIYSSSDGCNVRGSESFVSCGDGPFPVARSDYCPAEWHESEGHCYKLFTTASKWTQAQQTCETENANLVSIHNTQETEVVELLRNDQRVSTK